MGYVEAFAPGTWDYCDKCEKPKPLTEGTYTFVDGWAISWTCKDCK